MTVPSPAFNRSMTPAEWGLLAVLSVLWGGSFLFNGIAIREMAPLTFVACRVGLAAIVLNLALPLIGQRVPATRAVWSAFIGMGLLNNVIPFCLIVWAQGSITSGLAAILNATTPLFGAIVAHVLTPDEKLTVNKAIGVVLGLTGVVIMVGPSALEGFDAHIAGELAVLAAAFCYGLSGVYGRRFRRLNVPPIATAAGQMTASTIMMVPLALVIDQPWLHAAPSPAAVGAIFGIALLSTALAYVIFFRILATAGGTNLLLVTFLIPASAILLGVAFLGEAIEIRQLVGMGLIGAGLAAIDGRLPRRLHLMRSSAG